MLPDNYVLITDASGVVHDVIRDDIAGDDVQVFEGIISPGFINCHCHLELSHLKNKIPKHTGLVDFVLAVMQHRTAGSEIIEAAIAQAELEMINNGIVAVGDICNTSHTIAQKQRQKLFYKNFIEVSGFVPATAQARFNAAVNLYAEFAQVFAGNTTIVPHAPYSVSQKLFELIAAHSAHKLISIHNQESEEENNFFETGKGDINRLFKSLGIDINFFNAPKQSSLSYSKPFLQQAHQVILVHNTFANEAELIEINKGATQFYLCFCVLANEYICHSIPPKTILLNNLNNIVVGTDSLASNQELNILSELRCMKHHYPHLSHANLLQFATLNGASALGIEDKYGSFKRGRQPGIVLIDNLFSTNRPIILTPNQQLS